MTRIIESQTDYEEIGFRELRNSSDEVIAGVGKGKSYVVKRKSKALFRIVPLEQEVWETVIDFDEIKSGGIEANDLLAEMEKAKRKNPKKYGRQNTKISR